jgi:histidinol phosphatase-like PHP family hydrolase
MMNIRSDFHIHSSVSYDTPDEVSVEKIAEVAAGLGFKEIGITDHVHICSEGAKGFDQKNTDRDKHAELGNIIRGSERDIKIYYSWEVDYFDGGRYSFDVRYDPPRLDYILLGHHFTGHMRHAGDKEKARYLHRITMEMAREPYANIIAHPFYYPGGAEEHQRIISLVSDDQFKEAFSAMKEHGKAAEITSFQFQADLRSIREMKRMYGLARETGVKFVLNSDAHRLDELGGGYRCLRILEELGFSSEDFVDYKGLMELKQ